MVRGRSADCPRSSEVIRTVRLIGDDVLLRTLCLGVRLNALSIQRHLTLEHLVGRRRRNLRHLGEWDPASTGPTSVFLVVLVVATNLELVKRLIRLTY